MRGIALFADRLIQRLCVVALAVAAAFIGIVAIIGAADIFGTSIIRP